MSFLLVFLLYSALQVAIGMWVGRRVRTAGDFFVAGRALGPGLLFSTILAANIGAGSTVGAAGLGYRDGLAAVWWVLSAAIGSVVLAVWIGPAMRRAAARHDLQTVGDYLELRFGTPVRTVLSLLLCVGSIFILAGQLIAVATILNVAIGLSPAAGCALGGAVITAYFTAGGLLTSAWVNVFQLIVKMIGFTIALPIALASAGGWSGLSSLQPTLDYWHFWEGGASGLVYLAILGPAFIVSPGLLQKIYGARDDRSVRVGVGLNAAALALYAIVPVLFGMIARVQFPVLESNEMAMPMVFMHAIPPAVGALGLAAIFSAEISSADAVLFMLTTSLSKDIYRRFINPAASDAQLLRVTRLTAVAGGTLGVIVALAAASIIAALSIFYTLMGVGLFALIVGGLLTARGSTRHAMFAVVTGIGTVGIVQLGSAGSRILGITPALAGIIVSTIVFGIATMRTGGRHDRR
jgi:SSS family solute:Na+ symporter